jgi:hypothetical protein
MEIGALGEPTGLGGPIQRVIFLWQSEWPQVNQQEVQQRQGKQWAIFFTLFPSLLLVHFGPQPQSRPLCVVCYVMRSNSRFRAVKLWARQGGQFGVWRQWVCRQEVLDPGLGGHGQSSAVRQLATT